MFAEDIKMKLEELINSNYKQLNENDLYIWDYIVRHRKECERLSIDDLAKCCNVSRSTVLRFTKRLGLKGYSEFKVRLRMDNKVEHHQVNTTNVIDDYIEILNQYRDYNYQEINKCIYEAKNLYVYGTGTVQETVGLHIIRTFSMTGKLFLDINTSADFDAYDGLFYPGDVFIAISLSGKSKRLSDFINSLKAKGVIIVALVASNDCILSHIADYVLYVKTLPIISNKGRRELLISDYFVLVDFLVANYVDYVTSRDGGNYDIR